MKYNAASLNRLIEHFAALPGVGLKTAQRMAFHVLAMPKEQADDFADAIVTAQQKIKKCKICQNLTDNEVCAICSDARDATVVCVVESPRDVIAFERSRGYVGVYHVLHGLISPMDGVGPEEICIKQLLERVPHSDIKEVIMATNPTVEGEATAIYIARLLKPLGLQVSRLAYGIPIGGELELADDVTLAKALEHRNLL